MFLIANGRKYRLIFNSFCFKMVETHLCCCTIVRGLAETISFTAIQSAIVFIILFLPLEELWYTPNHSERLHYQILSRRKSLIYRCLSLSSSSFRSVGYGTLMNYRDFRHCVLVDTNM